MFNVFLSSRELRSKEDITFEKNGTVISYREPKAYVFEEHLSVGSHDDNFTTVNLPILVRTQAFVFYKA